MEQVTTALTQRIPWLGYSWINIEYHPLTVPELTHCLLSLSPSSMSPTLFVIEPLLQLSIVRSPTFAFVVIFLTIGHI